MRTKISCIWLILTLLLFPGRVMAQNSRTVTIGGTEYSSHNAPFCNWYRGSWLQSTYAPREIGQTGYITEVAYNCAYADTVTFADLRIYMGVTYDSVMEDVSDFLPMSELTMVYSATNILMGAHTGWYTFGLQAPFYYDTASGAQLVIVVAKYAPDYTSELEWYFDDADASRTMFVQCDDEDRRCALHPDVYDNANLTNSRAQTRLTMVTTATGLCAVPAWVTVNNITAHGARIDWASSDGATEWEIACGPSGFHPDSTGEGVIHVDHLTTNWYQLTSLTANSNYDVYVRSVCSATNKSSWRGSQIATQCDFMTEFPYEEGFEDYDANRLPQCWEKRTRNTQSVSVGSWDARSGWGSLHLESMWTDTVQVVMLPQMERVDTLMVSFFGYVTGLATVQVGVMEGEVFVPVSDVSSQMGNGNYCLQSIDVDLASYQGNGTRIALRVLYDDMDAEVYVDDLVVTGSSTSTSRRSFNVTLNEVDDNIGQLSAYTENPYHYLHNGTTTQVDSGATLYVQVRCVTSEVMVDSATINGVAFLPLHAHLDTTVAVVVTGPMDIRVTFAASLPDLHVVALSHSPMRAGHDATISWTVRNDGAAPTPNGVGWYDRLWISMECRVATQDDNPTLLGEFANLRVLNPGEQYTQTQTVHIPHGLDGDKYLFAITDAHDCYSILWAEDNVAPLPCPAATGNYVGARSAHCTGEHCQNYSGSNVNEYLEMQHDASYHDNFYYDTVHIQPGENPDLLVIDLIYPNTMYSGSHAEIYAHVTNAGNRTSSYRYDELYVSNSATFDSTAVWLAHSQHTVPVWVINEFVRLPVFGNGSLQPNETETDTFVCVLPHSIYGNAYFYLVADATNDSYEHAGEDNNVYRSGVANILLSPYPDLTVTDLQAPTEISTGDSLTINYTVLNQGVASTYGSDRTDRFFLSPFGGGITDEAIEIGSLNDLTIVHTMAPDEDRTYYKKIMLPRTLDSGWYYLYVRVDDEDDLFEYQYEDNNVMRMQDRIHVGKPDLTVVQVMAEDTLLIGADNRMAYTIENQGQGDVRNHRCKDLVTIARDPDGGNEQYSYSRERILSLQTDRTKTEEIVICPDRNIPEGLYYLLVEVNSEGNINEQHQENNVSTGVPVYLKRMRLPDLQVSNIQPASNMQAGTETQISFDITNMGNADMNQQLDITVMTTNGSDTTVCPIVSTNPSILGTTIAQNSSQHFVCTVFVSPTANASHNLLLVEVDPYKRVRELNDTNNISSASATVAPYPFDLTAEWITVANSASTGDSLTLTWRVTNQGSAPNSNIPLYISQHGTLVDAAELQDEDYPAYCNTALWRDGIYLSTDNQWDSSDIELNHEWSYHYMTPNDTYTETLSVQLPYRNWGDLYLVMKVDDAQNTYDNNRTNNVTAAAIHVDLGLTPDLRITSMTFDRDNVERGQSHMLYYTVQNQGLGATPQDTWVDQFYLDTVAGRNENALVGYTFHHGVLMPGESYTDSVEIDIPRYDIGTYALSGMVDGTDVVFEHNGEANNLETRSVYVTLPPPSDLIPGLPSLPETIEMDRLGINLSYTLRNAGSNYAHGKVKELVYVSEDNQWDNEDLLISTTTPTINIAVDETQTMYAHSDGAGVTPGYYYVIVRSNALNALNESSYENNTAVSSRKVRIDYPRIWVGQSYNESDVTKMKRYFRLDVSGEQVGQTMLCEVQGVNLQGLYLMHETSPTATHYEYHTVVPTTAGTTNYELMVPSLKRGTYYLLLDIGDIGGGNNQMHINTSIVDFDIVTVDAARGVNSGWLTTRIRGAKFDTIMDFRLERNGQYVPASKIHVKNSTDAYTTFDLTDLTPGQYDVVAELQGGVVVTKNQAFTIEEGLPANLNARIEGPNTVRVGIVFQASVEYSNTGMTDVAVEGLMVVSRNGHPIAYTPDGLNDGTTRLFIPIEETDSNLGVIRPGHAGTRSIFVYPNNAEEVVLDLYTVKRAQ